MDFILTTTPASAVTLVGSLCALLYLASFYISENGGTRTRVQGCRRLGLLDESNMSDQYSSEHADYEEKWVSKVKALFMYPIKSCGAIELSSSDVVATGLRYDRQFCFAQLRTEEAEKADDTIGVNSGWIHTWKFITQRKFPRLSQIQTELWLPDDQSPDYAPDLEWVESKGCLVCRFAFTPDWDWHCLFSKDTFCALREILKAKLSARSLSAEPIVTFKLPLQPDVKRAETYSREIMHIWKDSPEALNVTSELSQETLAKLKYFLGVSNPLGLFMADPMKRRDVFRNAPTREEAGYQPGTGFADAVSVVVSFFRL